MSTVDLDSMSGSEFELYVRDLLVAQGYKVEMTAGSGDMGVDLVATNSKGDRVAVQAKRYSSKVSRKAVSDAVAGMMHYGCNKSMAITTNYFTAGAQILASSTGCMLVDRDLLEQWATRFLKKPNSRPKRPKNSTKPGDGLISLFFKMLGAAIGLAWRFAKILTLLLLGLIVLAVVFHGQSAKDPKAVNSVAATDSQSRIQIYRVNSSNLNLREGPGTDKEVLMIVPKDTELVALGPQVKNGDVLWVKVRIFTGSNSSIDGWMNQKMLR